MTSAPSVCPAAAARHPIRAGLLPRALREPGSSRPFRLTLQDFKEFLMAYCACFLAVTLLIA